MHFVIFSYARYCYRTLLRLVTTFITVLYNISLDHFSFIFTFTRIIFFFTPLINTREHILQKNDTIGSMIGITNIVSQMFCYLFIFIFIDWILKNISIRNGGGVRWVRERAQ